jgi:gas vesicle protein
MSSKSNRIEKTFHKVGNDIRDRIIDFTSKVRTEAEDVKEAVCDTFEQQREFAADALGKASKKASRLTRRYPLQIFAGALVLGFVIGRIRR